MDLGSWISSLGSSALYMLLWGCVTVATQSDWGNLLTWNWIERKKNLFLSSFHQWHQWQRRTAAAGAQSQRVHHSDSILLERMLTSCSLTLTLFISTWNWQKHVRSVTVNVAACIIILHFIHPEATAATSCDKLTVKEKLTTNNPVVVFDKHVHTVGTVL